MEKTLLPNLRENIIVPFEFTSEIIKVAIPDSSKLGLIKNIKNITILKPLYFKGFFV